MGQCGDDAPAIDKGFKDAFSVSSRRKRIFMAINEEELGIHFA